MVKKTKRYSAKTKGRMMIIFMFFGVIIFTLGYTFFVNFREVRKLDRLMIRLEDDYLLLLDEEERLEGDIKRLKDPDYIARYVREKYMYSKEGELILRIVE